MDKGDKGDKEDRGEVFATPGGIAINSNRFIALLQLREKHQVVLLS